MPKHSFIFAPEDNEVIILDSSFYDKFKRPREIVIHEDDEDDDNEDDEDDDNDEDEDIESLLQNELLQDLRLRLGGWNHNPLGRSMRNLWNKIM
jgi:hypothetical protein